MKRKRSSVIISFLLVLAILLNLSGCSAKTQATDMTTGIKANKVEVLTDLSENNHNITDFAVRLFKESTKSGENTLISPLSVLLALSMTINGAKGDTLKQAEAVLGMKTQQLNEYLYSYIKSLPESEKYKLKPANSIWFTEDENFSVNNDFLQLNADYYGADIYKAPFNSSTLKDINSWVKEKTDGTIPKILDRISNNAVMYLVNALVFEAEWDEIYEEYQVHNGVFTAFDGTKQNVEFMYSGESKYLEDDKATGFIKYYKDSKYAFVALLPNQDISIDDYVGLLDGEYLNNMLTNAEKIFVEAAIPKFKTEYSNDMSEVLYNMGIKDAFNVTFADFSGLGSYPDQNIYINSVVHKTYMSVDEKGTKAGAATVVQMDAGSSMPIEIKTVCLDRPFVYMLIDCETNIPFFIGTQTNI